MITVANPPISRKKLNIARTIMFILPVFMLLFSLCIDYMGWNFDMDTLFMPIAIPVFSAMLLATAATYYKPVAGLIAYCFLLLVFPFSFFLMLASVPWEQLSFKEDIAGGLWMDVPPVVLIIYLLGIVTDLQKANVARKAAGLAK